MRRLPLFLALVVLAAVVAWSTLASRDTIDRTSDARSPPSSARAEEHDATRSTAIAPVDEAPAFSRVVGRTVDERGEPVAGARAWLEALDVAWRKGVEPPELRVRGGVVRAFATTTRADGSFSIEAPAPTARTLRFEVETADRRGAHQRVLHDGLASGATDLGAIVIPMRGAIEGFVRSRGGGALGGATVLVLDVAEGVESASSSDADGAFAIACVAAGTHRLHVEAPDHLDLDADAITVGSGEIVRGVELVLDRIGTIEGVVLDDAGAPVETLVEATPVAGGSAHASVGRSAKDGRFTIRLLRAEEHVLSIREDGIAPWSSLDTATPRFAPGARGVTIRVTRLVESVVTFVDARTREPIGLVGWESLPPDVEDVSNVTLPPTTRLASRELRVWIDRPPQRFVAWSPHYAPTVRALEPSPRQTIELVRQGEVRGALARGSKPLARARVFVEPLEGARAPSPNDPPWRSVTERPRSTSRTRVGRDRLGAEADAEGRFAIADLDPGRWALVVAEEGAHSMRRLEQEVVVRSGETSELGLVEVPASRSTLRLRFACDDAARFVELRRHVRVLLDGVDLHAFTTQPVAPLTYELRELAPGSVVVRWGEWLVGTPRTFEGELREGATSELAIDLRGLDECELCVQLLRPPGFTNDVAVRALLEPSGTRDLLSWPASSSDEPVCEQAIGGTRFVLVARSFDGVELGRSPTYELPTRGSFTATLSVR